MVHRSGSTFLISAAGLALLCAACTTTPKTSAKRQRASTPAPEDDFTLGSEAKDSEPDTSEATALFLSSPGDETRTKIPDVALSATDPDDEDAMFPTAAEPAEVGNMTTSIEGLINHMVPIRHFVATSDTAIRNKPESTAEQVKMLPKGRQVVGLVNGDWLCIGKDQFVSLTSLTKFTEVPTYSDSTP